MGAIVSALKRIRAAGHTVDHAHLVHVNPFPRDLGEVLGRYKKILIPEMNRGQLNMMIRAKYLVETIPMNKVKGLPFTAGAIQEMILKLLDDDQGAGGAR